MIHPEIDDRSPERRALDEQIAAEPQLPPLDVPRDTLRTTSEAYLRARRTRRFITLGCGDAQMIGGTDKAIPTMNDASGFDIGARVIQRYWPRARFQDGATREKYEGYSEMPIGRINQLLAFRTPNVEQEWLSADLDVPPNTMLYLARSQNAITVVFDDANADEMRMIVESLRSSLAMDILNNYAEAA